MRDTNHKTFFFCCIASVIFAAGCYHKPAPQAALFKVLDNSSTGINFSNTLHYNQAFNLFKYIYFYNGSGVGVGDFNKDGLVDLFFGSNQQQNKLFLNKGNLEFRDATQQVQIPQNGGWTTGISVVDINNDGLLDIYVCQVGNYEILHSNNQLLINQGIDKNGDPSFVDKAKEYGLDFSGFSTQAAFFDYDLDGDLDMFLLNHSVHENGTFRPRKDFEGTSFALSGDRIYRNDGASFTNVTPQTGINRTAISYGLGIAIADINLDGYPDIYIGNDFHENDYLYINQKNGRFKEEGEKQLMHTSQYSMGVDVADVNNDAHPEIFSVDMLPADPYILKRSLGEDAYDIFNYKLSVGYSHQYTRNNFQFNRKNNSFSEIGLKSGIAATDWSWAPLWMDFNNDGFKDLFISNGIPKRMNDIDYINFVTDGDIQKMIKDNNMSGKYLALINKFPEIKLYNKFFTNNGDLSFTDEAARIEGDQLTFSNGAAYADLDNDGDLDVIVNNIDAPALVYENKHNKKGSRTSIRINLTGPEKNVNAVGARVIVFANKGIRTYEKFPVRGFMSSMEQSLLIGLNNSKIDSMVLVWPDNTFQSLTVGTSATISVKYQKGLPAFNYSRIRTIDNSSTRPMVDITKATELQYLHEENHFNEFDREPLMPHMLSTEGPALAVADINHDGLEDVFIGGARDKQSALFLQTTSGKFIQLHQLALAQDSIYEDVAATWTDVNHDGHVDLIVASGGNEFYGKDAHNSPRVYLNDGKGNLTKKPDAFHQLYMTASSVSPYDFNGDGFTDLFISSRAVSWEYGLVPQSYLLQNDGTGNFIDVTQQYCPALAQAGFVTQAQWCDMDKDGDKDLLLSLEWGGITAYRNDKNVFTKKLLTDKKKSFSCSYFVVQSYCY